MKGTNTGRNLGGKIAGQILHLRKQERIKLHFKKCKKCDANIPYNKRHNTFCSKSCSVSYNNIGIRRHGSLIKEAINCAGCKKETYNEKYCSRKCSGIGLRKLTLEKFNNGISIGSPAQYEILVNIRGNRCENCGNDGMWFGKPLKLQVDHIDGDATNNFPYNLRLLCPNCHTQTPSWGMRNKGRGRKSRI